MSRQTTLGASASLLDSPAKMASLDPRDMMGLTLSFPTQCREGARLGGAFDLGPASVRPIRNVVIAGVGGSAIGGDLVRSIAEICGETPVLVCRDYELPSFVDRETLVIAASYSGNTEETLAAYTDARTRRAQIVCISSGGTLAARAAADGVPVCIIPGGQPPRASTGYLLFPMLAILDRRGLLNTRLSDSYEAAFAQLDALAAEYGPASPMDANEAKQIAAAVFGRIPVFYGSQGYRGVLANRWKCQFNENAKQHAFANVFPEQNHNEILAWTLARRQVPRWSIVYLRDPNEKTATPRIARRVEVSKAIIGRAAQSHEVWARGETLIGQMLGLMLLGDFASVYVAYLNAIDPTDIAGIDKLKVEMAKLKSR